MTSQSYGPLFPSAGFIDRNLTARPYFNFLPSRFLCVFVPTKTTTQLTFSYFCEKQKEGFVKVRDVQSHLAWPQTEGKEERDPYPLHSLVISCVLQVGCSLQCSHWLLPHWSQPRVEVLVSKRPCLTHTPAALLTGSVSIQ